MDLSIFTNVLPSTILTNKASGKFFICFSECTGKSVNAVCFLILLLLHMQSNRIGRMKQAAEIFILQIIEGGSWVGIVTFNNRASVLTGLKQISSNSMRQTLADYLPTSAGGGTNICSGVQSGFQVKEKGKKI